MNAQVNRDQFLAGRKKGIGGSDVAAILGFSPYKSPYQLWLDKTFLNGVCRHEHH